MIKHVSNVQKNNQLIFEALNGNQAAKYAEAIGHLRIELFRDYPYFYEGCLEDELTYLNLYFNCPQAYLYIVLDGNKLVGVCTGLPLSTHLPLIKEVIELNYLDVSKYYYIGEALLLPHYRGQGIMCRFFSFHEEMARNHEFSVSTFITDTKDEDDPKRPPSYRSLKPVWRHFGYKIHPELTFSAPWFRSDLKRTESNDLVFWSKTI